MTFLVTIGFPSMGSGARTQVLMPAQQTLYRLSHLSRLLYKDRIWKKKHLRDSAWSSQGMTVASSLSVSRWKLDPPI